MQLQKKHWQIIAAILLVAVVILVRNRFPEGDKSSKQHTEETRKKFGYKPSSKPPASKDNNGNFANNEADVVRHPQAIHYSKHAKCRMDCRHIDETEVAEILDHGTINYNKSNDRPEQCPTYALEGKTHDGQHVRIVYSFCNAKETTVVTVIDLDTDWKCNCY